MELAVGFREPLDRDDFAAVKAGDKEDTAIHNAPSRLAVYGVIADENTAGSTVAFSAAFLGSTVSVDVISQPIK